MAASEGKYSNRGSPGLRLKLRFHMEATLALAHAGVLIGSPPYQCSPGDPPTLQRTLATRTGAPRKTPRCMNSDRRVPEK